MITADDSRDVRIPHVDLAIGPKTAAAVASLIAQGSARSAHDCSDGGLLVAAAEMAFAGRVGLDIELDRLPTTRELDDLTACFAETPSRYLLEVAPSQLDTVVRSLRDAGIAFGQVGRFASHARLTVHCSRHGRVLDEPLDRLRETWLKPLDW
jgi:phosphoribosylformylglycinamidine synthase subunit PurSL